jgi:hypothetical protein
VLRLKGAAMVGDLRPVDETCECAVCKTFSRAYLHQLFCARSEVAASLLTYHNVYYMMRLMATLRQSIIDGNYPEYVADFMLRMYPDGRYPEWAAEALQKSEISLVSVDDATAKAAQITKAPRRGQGAQGRQKSEKLTKQQRKELREQARKERAAGHGPAEEETAADASDPKRPRVE